eukprot:11119-Heterococcus_DN1.PRE.2
MEGVSDKNFALMQVVTLVILPKHPQYVLMQGVCSRRDGSFKWHRTRTKNPKSQHIQGIFFLKVCGVDTTLAVIRRWLRVCYCADTEYITHIPASTAHHSTQSSSSSVKQHHCFMKHAMIVQILDILYSSPWPCVLAKNQLKLLTYSNTDVRNCVAFLTFLCISYSYNSAPPCALRCFLKRSAARMRIYSVEPALQTAMYVHSTQYTSDWERVSATHSTT